MFFFLTLILKDSQTIVQRKVAHPLQKTQLLRMILSLFTITTILGRWIEHDQRSKQITEPKKTLAEENCLKKSQETELKPTLIHARKSSIGLEVPESKLLITLDLDLKTTELKC